MVSHAMMGTAPWSSLNASLAGRLQVTTPLALPCFPSYNGQPHAIDVSTCDTIRNNYTSNSLRTGRVEGYMNIQNEMCLSDPADECVLDNTVLPAPMPSGNSTCGQGSVPSYHITVESASDVTAAFDFARAYGVELSVKNSGHDYMTRSAGRGTLTLYTHNLRTMTFEPSFVAEGCNNAMGTAAVTLAPGVDVSTAIAFADENNSTILTAYSPTVAVSGGWVLGAGHSVLSPVYGLGVDRVLSYDIVTPDGEVRTASACSNADLFWALRGGGGGTFGVVLSATHKVEPQMRVAFVDIRLPSNTTTQQAWQWIELQVRESLGWGQVGWGGHVAGTYLTYFNPLPEYTANGTAKARGDFARASEFAESIGGRSQVVVGSSFHELWTRYLAPNFTAQGARGQFISTRLVHRDQFATRAGQDAIVGFLHSVEAVGFDPRAFYSPAATPFVWNGTAAGRIGRAREETAVTGAWYEGLWSLSQGMAVAWNSTYATRLSQLANLTIMTRQSERLLAGRGAYVNEANPFTSDWADSWWGADKYARLVAIKDQYDPDRLLNCWKCVGFEDKEDVDADRFRCQGKLQWAIDELIMQAAGPS